MSGHFVELGHTARFDQAGMVKSDLFNGSTLFAGLNCLEAGQSQAIHSHAGADKFYLVVSGKARMTVGAETRLAETGTLIFAPAGIPHGVAEAVERTVLLVAMAPPPASRR